MWGLVSKFYFSPFDDRNNIPHNKEEKIKYVIDPLDCVKELKFKEGETIFLLYGTDPLSPARKVRKILEEHLNRIDKNEKVH